MLGAETMVRVEGLSFEVEGQTCHGRAWIPEGENLRCIILLHGLPGHSQPFSLAEELAYNGNVVVHFHYRGSWAREGVFTLAGALYDAQSAVEYITRGPNNWPCNRIDSRRTAIIGHSMGASIAFRVATSYPKMPLALLAPFFPNAENLKDLIPLIPELLSPFHADDTAFIQELLEGIDEWDSDELAKRLVGSPILLVCGTKDELTPEKSNFRKFLYALYRVGTADIHARTILGAGHQFIETRAIRQIYLNTVTEWVKSLD